MAVNDFTGQNIQDTYQKIVQTDGANLADGTGSLLPISFNGQNVIISGSLTATEYSVTSSVTNVIFQQQSGSTIFGDSTDDTHRFTGSLKISGSGIDFQDQGVTTFSRKGGEFFQLSESFASVAAGDSHVRINLDAGSSQKNILINPGVGDVDFEMKAGALGLKPFFIQGSDGFVGIGNNTPQEILTVEGNISASGNTTLGNAATDTHTFTGAITASSDISASKIYAEDYYINDAHVIAAAGGTTFFGRTNKATTITGSSITLGGAPTIHVTASGNISSSGDIIAKTGTGSFGELTLKSNIIHEGDTDTFFGFTEDNNFKVNVGGQEMVKIEDTGTTINVGAADRDFKIAGDGGNLMILNDGSNRAVFPTISGFRIGLADATANATLEVGGNISSSGAIKTDSHITASGNISSSGDILTDGNLYVNDTAGIYADKIRRNTDSDNTTKILLNDEVIKINTGHASTETMNIQLHSVLVSGSLNVEKPGHITSSGNISSSGDVIAKTGTGSFGYVSASNVFTTGDISASGAVIFEGLLSAKATSGNNTFSSHILMDSAKSIAFADTGEKITGNGTDLTLNSGNDISLTATRDVNIPANVGLTFGSDSNKIESDGNSKMDIIYGDGEAGTGVLNLGDKPNMSVSASGAITASGFHGLPYFNAVTTGSTESDAINGSITGSTNNLYTLPISLTSIESSPSVFTNTAGEIAISRAGIYKIEYNTTLEVTTTLNRTVGGVAIMRKPDGGSYLAINGTAGFTYLRTTSMTENSTHASTILSIASDDVVKVVFWRNAAQSATSKVQNVPSGSAITITALS